MEMIAEASQVARHEAERASAAATAAGATGRTSQGGEFLTFRLGAEEYGIDILRVQEIRSYEQPTRIAMPSAAGNALAVAWMMPATWVSS